MHSTPPGLLVLLLVVVRSTRTPIEKPFSGFTIVSLSMHDFISRSNNQACRILYDIDCRWISPETIMTRLQNEAIRLNKCVNQVLQLRTG